MGCNSCKYLKYSDKKDGLVDGSIYYCTKIKKYVNGADDGCDSYHKDYGRKVYEKNEIYNNGRKYYNDNSSNLVYLFILISLIIIALCINLFS